MRICSFVSGLAIAALCGSASSAEPDSHIKRALGLVNQALQAEIDGDLLVRERLLNESEHAAPECGPANWFLGRVSLGDGKWATVDESIELAKASKQLDEYEAMRAQQPASVQGNWQAAQWCAKQGMGAQCRAHLENIIVLDHDNQAARQALGHVLFGNQWLNTEDQRRLAQRAEFSRVGLAKYQAQVSDWIAKALHGNASVQEDAVQHLQALNDPLAIPAMEAAADQFGRPAALIVSDWLGKVEHREAALSLARLAVASPDEQVQQAAIKNLKHKSLYDFVPDLLSAMSSPIVFTTVPVMNRNGTFAGFRQFFAVEGADEYRLLEFDASVGSVEVTLPRPIATTGTELLSHSYDPKKPFGQRNTWRFSDYRSFVTPELEAEYADSVAAAAWCETVSKINFVASVGQRQSQAAMENQQIGEFNLRVARVIAEVSQEEFAQIPRDVWDWWDRYNKTDYQRSKTQRRSYQSAHFNIPQYREREVASPLREHTNYRIVKSSCFVVGTQVSTLRGPRSIETIMPGDMVLSRDIASGELRYQPVVCGTQRPPTRTVLLNVDNDTIHATCSHLLWVSGRGWTQACDIKPGDLLHAAAEPAVVMSTKPGDILPTYNLIVMDTHTYFVGSSRVLSHDVLPRGSVHELIPGEFAVAASAP